MEFDWNFLTEKRKKFFHQLELGLLLLPKNVENRNFRITFQIHLFDALHFWKFRIFQASAHTINGFECMMATNFDAMILFFYLENEKCYLVSNRRIFLCAIAIRMQLLHVADDNCVFVSAMNYSPKNVCVERILLIEIKVKEFTFVGGKMFHFSSSFQFRWFFIRFK